MHLELVENPDYPEVFLTQEDDDRDGMINMKSFYSLPEWALEAIHDYYEEWHKA